MASNLDIAALRDRITNYRAVKWPSMSLPIDGVQTLLDAAEERDQLRVRLGSLLAAAEKADDLIDDLMGYACDSWDWKYGDGWREDRDAFRAAIAAAKETTNG